MAFRRPVNRPVKFMKSLGSKRPLKPEQIMMDMLCSVYYTLNNAISAAGGRPRDKIVLLVLRRFSRPLERPFPELEGL